ncbi:hypothetical protein N7510_005812 [Penicillium lagena]|uniref:uncharacterized protein n=1 Tax=Penicillium lagena TaxID=94218 RepID=UPI002541CFAD|nr:uncharacterized protein N7510_005812 [Penicillium lagena]KAJ5612618.1 hypothetical protein N7510_005812 [Penicillium lagena]
MASQVPPQVPVRGATDYLGALGPAIVGVSVSLCAFATILVALRVYTYFFVVRNKGGWALLWAVVAWGLGVPSTVLYSIAAYYGAGNHIWIVERAPKLSSALLFLWITANLVCFSVGFAKLSMTMYILEVQDRTYKWGKWILLGAVGVNFMCYIVTIPMVFTQCTPSEKLWYQTLPGNCDGTHRAFYWAIWTGAWGTATDLLLAIYPVFIIWNLRIRTQLKLVISVLMGLGVVTAACSLAKTINYGRLLVATDQTYEIAPLMIYGITEMWVVLIASSGAPLWPLVRIIAGGARPQYGPSSAYASSRNGYLKSVDTNHDPVGLHSVHGIASRNHPSRTGSEDAMISPRGIMMTQDLTVKHESVRQMF